MTASRQDAEWGEKADIPRPIWEALDYDEMRVRDIRLRICKEIGSNTTARSPLGKDELNSIHAFLTGEFAYPKQDHNTPSSPPIADVRAAVAAVADIGKDDPERPFRHDELVTLHRQMKQNADSRPIPS